MKEKEKEKNGSRLPVATTPNVIDNETDDYPSILPPMRKKR